MDSIVNDVGFDIIGDVHGCWPELCELTDKLGYEWISIPAHMSVKLPVHPDGRILAFVGDLIDRGPDSVRSIQLACRLVEEGLGVMVLGNHEDMFIDYVLSGHFVKENGTEFTINELKKTPGLSANDFIKRFQQYPVKVKLTTQGKVIHLSHSFFPQRLAHHDYSILKGKIEYLHDYMKLINLHMWNYSYQDIGTWEGQDEYMVHGHVQTRYMKDGTMGEPLIHVDRVFSIDTSAAYGGKLTALRFPELEFVSVDAKENYTP